MLYAIKMLLMNPPLLDTLDVKCNCNVIECLVSELHRVGLLSEPQAQVFTAQR